MASRLQVELHKRRPFASRQQEATLALWRTADQVGLEFNRLFRGHGLTSAQYNILRILRGAGTPLPVLDIAARTITVVPGITGLVDRLERRHWVERRRCPEDRRVIRVAITPAGLELLARLDAPLLALHRRLLDGLAADELDLLISLLDRIRARCEERES